METTMKRHLGRNISRIREMKGMKQETLAELLGISQQKMSVIENTEELDDTKLAPIAAALEVPTQAIKEYSDERMVNIISNNTFHESPFYSNTVNYHPTFNPLDKLVEAYEENKKLYERLLAAEKEKLAYLEQLLKK
ncbi:helix-turn-helix transcriptional regulator [Flavobacterium sp. xlx-214]|uniref:helix-turn-helix domain-containing protein n=1 Tax=unclassified Flavobacterium TaxID=196869 RepID=UPI0013D5AFE2|nr:MULTISPECIES: helix-turn-helix transcriptional regulator [unclassified Flavobacterium]MBA5792536.1 helix-turn-helix transcriptional regulator [Flavobacterium sp. xlx-221]QMI82314.1 helix-turn-helix transcriptional regulator [Flavobacterium sp. xlx-214]